MLQFATIPMPAPEGRSGIKDEGGSGAHLPNVLIVIPYHRIYPPFNGGTQRSFNILHQLTRHFDVTALVFQDPATLTAAFGEYPSLKRARFVHAMPEELWPLSWLPARIRVALQYRWYQRSFAGPADSDFLLYYPVLRRILRAAQFDFIIVENMASLNMVRAVRRLNPRARIVFNAHNVDTRLALAAVEKGDVSLASCHRIRSIESSLHLRVHGVMACSAPDLDALQRMNGHRLRGAVVPNGVVLANQLYDGGVRDENCMNMIFCGSLDYGPNRDGLAWFYSHVWPLLQKELPEATLTVVGSGKADAALERLRRDPAVRWGGYVPDVRPHYNAAAVAIVPLLSGSGTRLKILEAMGLGVPVVTTVVGAEGITGEADRHLSIADTAGEFAAAVVALLRRKSLRLEIQKNARTLVAEHYDWNVVGDGLKRWLEGMLEKQTHPLPLLNV